MPPESQVHEDIGFLKGMLAAMNARMDSFERSSRDSSMALKDDIARLGEKIDGLLTTKSEAMGRTKTWHLIVGCVVTLISGLGLGKLGSLFH